MHTDTRPVEITLERSLRLACWSIARGLEDAAEMLAPHLGHADSTIINLRAMAGTIEEAGSGRDLATNTANLVALGVAQLQATGLVTVTVEGE